MSHILVAGKLWNCMCFLVIEDQEMEVTVVTGGFLNVAAAGSFSHTPSAERTSQHLNSFRPFILWSMNLKNLLIEGARN
jgi:hypothetical protein